MIKYILGTVVLIAWVFSFISIFGFAIEAFDKYELHWSTQTIVLFPFVTSMIKLIIDTLKTLLNIKNARYTKIR